MGVEGRGGGSASQRCAVVSRSWTAVDGGPALAVAGAGSTTTEAQRPTTSLSSRHGFSSKEGVNSGESQTSAACHVTRRAAAPLTPLQRQRHRPTHCHSRAAATGPAPHRSLSCAFENRLCTYRAITTRGRPLGDGRDGLVGGRRLCVGPAEERSWRGRLLAGSP